MEATFFKEVQIHRNMWVSFKVNNQLSLSLSKEYGHVRSFIRLVGGNFNENNYIRAMGKESQTIIYDKILSEHHQNHETRKDLFIKLENELNRPVLAFFTSFYHDVMIQDQDAVLIEGVLQKMDLSKGLALIINSPGGIGISAEKIINTCRSYSGTGNFIAIVPGKAKSAATMVCMGASEIYMSKTSELGPVDPQVTIKKDGTIMNVSLWNIVKSYEELFVGAEKTIGNLQPYLLQLSNYDYREIKEFKTAIDLAEDIAIRALTTGMMAGLDRDSIKSKIKPFLSPERTKSHGRSIFYEEAKDSGLKILLMDLKSRTCDLCYELYLRLDNYTSMKVAKCIETKTHSYATLPPGTND